MGTSLVTKQCSNPIIHNSEIIPTSDWIIYDPKLNFSEQPKIFLNYIKHFLLRIIILVINEFDVFGFAKGPWEEEAGLYEKLWKEAKIILTPGSSQHADRPGWFRMCYAFVPAATLELALGRLSKYVAGRRRGA